LVLRSALHSLGSSPRTLIGRQQAGNNDLHHILDVSVCAHGVLRRSLKTCNSARTDVSRRLPHTNKGHLRNVAFWPTATVPMLSGTSGVGWIPAAWPCNCRFKYAASSQLEKRLFDGNSLSLHDARQDAIGRRSQPCIPKTMCTIRCTSPNRFSSRS
jgi:hypothetical protein